MPKRECPFNNCTPLQLKTHVESKHVLSHDEGEMKQIYEKTQSMLKAGAKNMQPKKSSKDETVTAVSNVSCKNCKKSEKSLILDKCAFCDKNICVYCLNTCYHCHQSFCVLCSVINYDSPEERSYCLSCSGT